MCGEPSFTALCPTLRSLSGPWSKTQGVRGAGTASNGVGGGLLTSFLGMTIESGTADPEAERDVNNWFSLWEVCGLLGKLSWDPNHKPRGGCPLTVKIPHGAHGCPCTGPLEMSLWMRDGG